MSLLTLLHLNTESTATEPAFQGNAFQLDAFQAVDASATADLTGTGTTASPGTLTATGGALAALTGVGTATSAGALLAAGAARAVLTGTGTTASPGTLTATGAALAALTGTGTTATAGTLTGTGGALVLLAGVGLTASAGSLTASADGEIPLTGIALTASPGDLAATGGAVAALTGVGLAASAGDVTAEGAAGEAVTPPKAETGGAVPGSGRWRRADDDTVYLRARGGSGRGRTQPAQIEVGPPCVELDADCAEGHGTTTAARLAVVVPLALVGASAKSRTSPARVQTNDLVEVLRIIEMLALKKAA